MYDVIVIGARCAGATTAMLLARAGARVLLLDRADFPSDTISTHYLHPVATARLAEWGLLDPLLASGCPPVREMTFSLPGNVVLRGAPLPAGETGFCLAPRRTVLDELLVEAAVVAGAEFRPGCSFREPLWEPDRWGQDRVAGVRYFRGGLEFTERAPLVIGADGKHSLLARTVGAPTWRDLGMISCMFYGYWDGLPDRGAQVFVRDGQAVLAFPTNDDRHCVLVSWPHSRFNAVKRDLEQHFLDTVELLAPEVRAAMGAGSRIVGSGDLPNCYRVPFGSGWALAGDAGHTRDPAGAQGIGHAFEDAAVLAEAIAGTLGEAPEEVDRAVAGGLAERQRSTVDGFETNAAFAEWFVPPDLLAVLRAAQHDPERVSQFLGVYAGRVSMAEFRAGRAAADLSSAPG